VSFHSMNTIKSNIIAQLQKDILLLQGFKKISGSAALDVVPSIIKNAFPNNEYPLGAVHEFISTGAEGAAATGGRGCACAPRAVRP